VAKMLGVGEATIQRDVEARQICAPAQPDQNDWRVEEFLPCPQTFKNLSQ
jgi:hypothetical protein